MKDHFTRRGCVKHREFLAPAGDGRPTVGRFGLAAAAGSNSTSAFELRFLAVCTRAETQHRLFLSVSAGLEPWLNLELAELGLTGKPVSGGVELRATTEQLWTIHTQCRLAEGVRVRLRSFRARQFDALVSGLGRLPWHAYLAPDRPLNIRVTCHRSRLWHSEAVAERTRIVLNRWLGPLQTTVTPPSGSEVQTIYVRIAGDIVQPSVDASGDRLHRRGHRTHVGDAPIRETLAAALVLMLGHTGPEKPQFFWDPFCGSGCVVIEWIERQLGISAGRDRRFAFENWPIHDRDRYAEWSANRATRRTQVVHARGSDIDAAMVAAARFNADHAAIGPNCTWLCGDFESCVDSIPLGSVVVTNPPYGIRSGNTVEYRQLLDRFESVLLRRFDLRPAIVLLPLPLRPFKPALDWRVLAKFYNGGLRVQALRLG